MGHFLVQHWLLYVFLKNVSLVLPEFPHKGRVDANNVGKVTKPYFFIKIWFGPNSPKWGIFLARNWLFYIFLKNVSLVLPEFLHKGRVGGHNVGKVTKTYFSTKIWYGPNSPKSGIFGLEIVFFIYFLKTIH